MARVQRINWRKKIFGSSPSPSKRTGRSRTPKRRRKTKSKSPARSSITRSRIFGKSKSPARKTRAKLPRSHYVRAGRKGGRAPKSQTYRYDDVPKVNGKKKPCFLRRYSSKKHKYYVPKTPYWRSCGYDSSGKLWKGFNADKRRAFKVLLMEKAGITEKNPSYTTLAPAYNRVMRPHSIK